MLKAVLITPEFLFRMEESGGPAGTHRLNDFELATRLSYFLWSSAPDEELRRLAAEGRLHEDAVLRGQVAPFRFGFRWPVAGDERHWRTDCADGERGAALLHTGSRERYARGADSAVPPFGGGEPQLGEISGFGLRIRESKTGEVL